MTDQFTSLTPAALREIIDKLDLSLAVFAQHQGPLGVAEQNVRQMLTELRTRLADRLASHPDNQK